MKLAYAILASLCLFMGFMVLSLIPAGFRELLVGSWIAVAIYCFYLFAKRDAAEEITSYDRQRSYAKLLSDVGKKKKPR